MRGLVNNINILNMAAVSLFQVKKLRWGKLSQILQGKLSALKYHVQLLKVKFNIRRRASCKSDTGKLYVKKELFCVRHVFVNIFYLRYFPRNLCSKI